MFAAAGKFVEIHDPHFAALGRFLRLHLHHAERKGRRCRAPVAGDRLLVLLERWRQRRLENVASVRRDGLERVERILCHAPILGQHFGRGVDHPVGQERGVVLGESAVVEHQKEFASVRSESLQRVRHAGREVPEVARCHVAHKRRSVEVQRGQSAIAVEHQRPFVRLVPVEFADAAGGEPHVHARDLCRDREVVHIHLARPAAVLDAAMHHGERTPEHLRQSVIGRRRREAVRI